MVSAQEELDWEVYQFYGLIDEDLTYDAEPPELALGERAAGALASEEALGDHLLALAAAARGAGLDAEAALRAAVARALDAAGGPRAS